MALATDWTRHKLQNSDENQRSGSAHLKSLVETTQSLSQYLRHIQIWNDRDCFAYLPA